MTTLEDMFQAPWLDAWRLEVRDVYDIPGQLREQFEEFLATGELMPRTRENSPWIRLIEAAGERGATIGRVRLVGHPVTPYTRYEFAAYRDNIAAGDDIRIADRTWLDDTWGTAPDFWMFDHSEVWAMSYSDTGVFLGAEPVDDATPYLELRRRIEQVAVPYGAYQLADVPAPRTELPDVPLTLPAGVMTG